MIDLERKLLGECLEGVESAWDVLVRRYSRLVYHTIKRTLSRYGNTAHADVVEDIFQEFFLSLFHDDFKKLRQFRGEKGCSLASWLRVVASRLTIDYLRRQSSPASGTLTTSLNHQPDFSETLLEQEKEWLLSQAIQTLSTRDQSFVELYLQQALPPQEIATILHTSVGAVYTQRSRIVDKLRRALRKSEAL